MNLGMDRKDDDPSIYDEQEAAVRSSDFQMRFAFDLESCYTLAHCLG